MIVSLAGTVESELGSAMSNAITGLIDGTKTAQEAFSTMFKNIGKAFIDMATQMIAKALIMQVLGILGGGSSFGMGNGRASGGPVLPGNTYLVGEHGPELLTMNGNSGNVTPASRSQDAMSRWTPGNNAAAAASAGESGGGAVGEETSTQVNISGGVLQFGGDEFIRKDQIPSIVSQAGKMGEQRALRKLQMSSSTRRRLGL